MKTPRDVAKDDARRRRGPKPATPERLEKAALHYLERFATSAENLRRVLMRRVQRSAQLHDTDPKAGQQAVDDLIARYLRAGLLDDRAFAEARAASLHRQGKSARAIAQALAQKGVAADTAQAALEALKEDVGEHSDLAAAIHYARRRRLGPWRRQEREGARERELAALGRQGFGYETARKVVEAETQEELEDRLHGEG
jgi:regulatory protein